MIHSRTNKQTFAHKTHTNKETPIKKMEHEASFGERTVFVHFFHIHLCARAYFVWMRVDACGHVGCVCVCVGMCVCECVSDACVCVVWMRCVNACGQAPTGPVVLLSPPTEEVCTPAPPHPPSLHSIQALPVDTAPQPPPLNAVPPTLSPPPPTPLCVVSLSLSFSPLCNQIQTERRRGGGVGERVCGCWR